MSKNKQILSNTAAVLAGDSVYHFINFLASVLVARSLGKEGYGEFSFIYVYLSFFEAIVQFGLNSVLTRELSRERADAPRVLGNALILRIILIGCALPVAWLVIGALGYPLTVKQGVFLASFQLFLTLRPVFEAVFRARLLMIYPVLWNTVRALVNLVFIGLIVFYQPALPLFILAYLASGLIGFLGLIFSSRKLMKFNLRPSKDLMGYLLRESAPLVLSAYLTLLYYRTDVMMLSMMRTFRDVGYYSVATRLGESLTMISGALLVSFFPLFSKTCKTDRAEFNLLTSKAFRWIFLLGFPIVIGGGIAAKDLILLFFGREYLPSVVTFAILLGYTFFCFVGSLLANLLIACGRQIADMWISFFLVILNIGLNLFLIPLYNYNGAAVATVITETIGVLIYFSYALKNPAIQISFPGKELVTALKVNALYLIVLLVIKKFNLPVLIFVFFGILIYAGLLFLFRLLSWTQIRSYFHENTH